MSVKEKIIEGKYFYLEKGNAYSEESFYFERESIMNGHLIINSEVVSRVKTGEFLKINTKYEVTKKFEPVKVEIKRQLGAKKSIESYLVDLKTKNYTYSFENGSRPKYFEKVLTQLPHIAAPSFITSTLMTNYKKIDPVHKTPFIILTSENTWTYESPFHEREVYIEMLDLKPVNIQIEGNKLSATHCKLFQVDENGRIIDDNQEFWLSKHFNIPYQAKFGKNLEIRIDTLKNHEDRAKKIF